MSIKRKASIIIIVTAMLLVTAVYFMSEAVLVGNVLNQEKEITRQYLERVNNALEYKSRSLNSTIIDWAEWDDTYNFMQGENAEYIVDNLSESTLLNLKLNLIMYIDTNGNIEYSTMIDFDKQKKSEVYQSILDHYRKGTLITKEMDTDEIVSGYLTLPEGIMLIANKTIMKSDESGPALGTLVFGRFVDDSEIKELQELTGLKFTLESLNTATLPSEFGKASQALENGESYYIKTIDDNQIAGYSIINDIYGENAILVKTIVVRRFYQKAKADTNFYIMILIVCGVAILGVSIIILQRIVIARLFELDRFMTKIRSKGDATLRIQVTGNDEISNLAQGMNRMLEELNKTSEDNQRLLREVMGYDELKNEFFSNISHEFRTPINVLLNTLQLVELQNQNAQFVPDPSKTSRYVGIMRQNCYRLLRLSNNLIDITKMDAGFFEINLSNYNVVEVIEGVTLSVADYIQEKGVKLQFDTEVEEKIMAIDADKIERIMLNLLSNAVKFTEKNGTIFVNIRDKGERIEVSVRDTGIGIPKDKLDIIFERFRQVNSLMTRNHEGSGIGLSIVKNLVELHGGSIRVESEYGAGTEFIFQLPVKVCQEEADQKLPPLMGQNNVDKINIEFSDV